MMGPTIEATKEKAGHVWLQLGSFDEVKKQGGLALLHNLSSYRTNEPIDLNREEMDAIVTPDQIRH